jgi:hypothetical protein
MELNHHKSAVFRQFIERKKAKLRKSGYQLIQMGNPVTSSSAVFISFLCGQNGSD